MKTKKDKVGFAFCGEIPPIVDMHIKAVDEEHIDIQSEFLYPRRLLCLKNHPYDIEFKVETLTYQLSIRFNLAAHLDLHAANGGVVKAYTTRLWVINCIEVKRN